MTTIPKFYYKLRGSGFDNLNSVLYKTVFTVIVDSADNKYDDSSIRDAVNNLDKHFAIKLRCNGIPIIEKDTGYIPKTK